MMPGIDREERRKKRVPVIGFILFGMLVVAALCQRFEPSWQWVPVAVGTVAVTAVGVSIDMPAGRGWGSRRRGSDLTLRGREDDDGPAGVAAHQWHVLDAVSQPLDLFRKIISERPVRDMKFLRQRSSGQSVVARDHRV